MEVFHTIMDLLGALLPAVVVFVTAWYLLKTYLEKDYQRRILELRQVDKESTLTLRLQAYERLTLFVERIAPENLLLRANHTELSASDLHTVLMQEIRSEYEHNLTQQIYVSPEAWTMVKTVKEELIELINSAFIDMKDGAGGTDLGRSILKKLIDQKVSPNTKALRIIKREVQELF